MDLSSAAAETGTVEPHGSDHGPEVRLHHLQHQPSARAARLAWIVLGYNVFVVLWGAFVRASGSGAGCGRHWPLCNGEVVPQPRSIATVIEAGHRLTSGIALLGVVWLAIATFRAVPRGARARKAVVAAGAFMLGEALLGAGLVLYELVAHDASMKRADSMILHLSNPVLLLGALALTAWFLRQHGRDRTELAPKRQGLVRAAMAAALGGVLVLGASGAIAALGDTLFPVRSLAEGFAQDLSPVAHAFTRLRVYHPFFAIAAGALVLGSATLVRSVSPSATARRISHLVTILFVVQFTAGLVNLVLLAPTAMQLVHLLLADAMWISLVLMAWEAWTPRSPSSVEVA